MKANPYRPPMSNLIGAGADDNNSGRGRWISLPANVEGWSWGAFLLNWIWAVFNRTWVGLLCFVPFVGFFVAIYLGIKGRELAWRNKRWDSIEHFNAVQRRWSIWAISLTLIVGLLVAVSVSLASHHH